jgi:transcriptional regulator with XRE-family HTH domain
MALSLELARARKARGLPQQAVADAIHINRSRVAELERDSERVSFGRIVAYASVHGIRLEAVTVSGLGLPAVDGPKKGRPVRPS